MAQEKLTKEIYIRTDTELLVSTLFVLGDDRYRIIPFGTTEEICSPEYIINENLFNRAKRIHEVYIEQQKGKGVTKLKMGSRFQSSNDTPMCPRRIIL